MVSTKGDVYSYGILMMETMTGKKPTDDEVSLREYVNELLNGRVVGIGDASMDDDDVMEQCVRSVLSLALNCTEEAPVRRISMDDVVSRLVRIRHGFLKVGEAEVEVRTGLKVREEEVGLVRG